MERIRTNAETGILFGDTDMAGCIPDYPAPSAGPVYLEGRLVLSYSFCEGGDERAAEPAFGCDCFDTAEMGAAPKANCSEQESPVELYRIWDDLAQDWYPSDIVLIRDENADTVVRSGDEGTPLWSGALDTQRRIIPLPDLDGAGAAANEAHDLRWKLSR